MRAVPLRFLLLLVGSALAVAGCAAPHPVATAAPEAFTAVYEYQLSWGDRHGFVNVTLAGPVNALARDFETHPAYVFTWEFPSSDLGPVPHALSHYEAVLDATLQVVRTRTCLAADDRPCDTRSTTWPDSGHSGLFQYGLPTTMPPGSPGRTDHEDGSVDIDGMHYAPHRLVPDFIDLTSTAGPEWLRLTEYHAGASLPPIGVWPSLPALLANETASWTMFPGDGDDLFGAGWTPLDALAAVRQDPEAAAILAEGGCVVGFDAQHRHDGSATAGALRRDGAYVDFLLQDRQGATTRWSLSRNNGLTSIAGTGWSEPERSEGWPFPSKRGCEEMATGPAPRLDARQALDATSRFVTLEDRDLHFSVTRQPSDHVSSGWTPRSIGLAYTIIAFPQSETSVTLPTQPSTEQHGYGHGATFDGLTGTLVQLFTPDGASPA
ncbi:MAG TPA: hypothetical protein VM327_06660 [Candidatus Thermoplasmatota archaeon]|nr:hypothetical protein [Candidatus Thermoplasmatota archaeon]